MLGHCAGLRNTQKLGDYVLAHGYVREDHVLDHELALWMPIPALAEVQVALEQAVSEVTGLAGFELKRVMRTGKVASVDNRKLGDRRSGQYTEIESGRRAKRPQLAAALKALKKHKAKLVVAKLDRLSRNTCFLLTLMRAAWRYCSPICLMSPAQWASLS
jgi:Resolvase, N terminal domain